MRVLHLFSNSKWTGPAEPALNLCVALRDLGVECHFACAPDAGPANNKVVETARERGVHTLLDFHLRKHRHPIKNFLDQRRLRKLLRETHYDCIHCHLDNDHRIAVAAAGAAPIPIIRSSYAGEGFDGPSDIRRLLAKTDFLIQPSRAAMEHDQKRYGFAEENMALVPGAVDVARFDPHRALPDARKSLGLAPDDFVVGIVARIQRHRHYADLFNALSKIMKEYDHVHTVVIGRGTHQEEVAMEPVRQLGQTDRVHFTGFIDGDDYVGMVAAFDVKVFLVPGSDGTCRAVREAMALAKPLVVARRGMLPEIVEDGKTGVVFDGSEEGLVAALKSLITHPEKVAEMGKNARATTISTYSLRHQGEAVQRIYSLLLNP